MSKTNSNSISKEIASTDHERISECISNVLDHYLVDMENHFNGDLYNIILSEVERPLIEKVMCYTQNNQSNTAQILGVSRGTLRKKLNQYAINTKNK